MLDKAMSKVETVIEMALRPEGVTGAEAKAATGWPSVSIVHHCKRHGVEVRKVNEGDGKRKAYRYFGKRIEASAESPGEAVGQGSARLRKLFERLIEAHNTQLGIEEELCALMKAHLTDLGRVRFLRWLIEENLAGWTLEFCKTKIAHDVPEEVDLIMWPLAAAMARSDREID